MIQKNVYYTSEKLLDGLHCMLFKVQRSFYNYYIYNMYIII